MKPEISVIIPSYNHEKYIGEAIESVINQTFKNWELVIIDDGSSDHSIEIIKQYKDQRIKLLTQENHGVAYTLNKGIELAKGKYICFLDSDDVYREDKLEKQLQLIEKGFDIVTSKIKTIDGSGMEIINSEITRWYNDFDDKKIFGDGQEFNFLRRNSLCKPAVMIKKEIFDTFGLFREDLLTAYDFHFWLKIIRNVKIARSEETLFFYRWHGENETIKNNPRMKLEVILILKDYLSKLIKENKISKDNYLNYIESFDDFLRSDNLIGLFLPLSVYMAYKKLDSALALVDDEEFLKFIESIQPKFNSAKIIDHLNSEVENLSQDLLVKKEVIQEKEVALRNAKSALLGAEKNLEEKIDELKFVKSSKFWKLRNIYIAIKNILMLGQLGKLAKTSALVIKRDGLAVFFRRLNIFYKEQLIPKENVGKKIVGEKPQERWPDNLPLVSVVIPCFNYGSFVRGAMDSVLAQTFQNFEIIIIDDGSTDKETTFALKNINHPKTKVIFQENQGLAETRNRGAELAKGKYVCFLDADDMLEPTYLEKTLLLLEADENLGCAYSWLQCFGDDDYSVWHTQDLDPYRMRDANLAASHSVVRKSAWEKIRNSNGKGFLSKYNGYFEDWVFWIDMIQAGYGGKVIEEPLIRYRIHKKSLSATHKPGYEKKLKELKRDRHKFFSSKPFAEKMRVTVNNSIKIMNPLENLSGESNYSHSEKSILFVVPWLICGGAETVLFEAIKGLQKEGFSIYIITTEFSSNEWKEKFLKITPFVYDFPSILYKENLFDFLVNFLETRRVGQLCGIHSIFFYEFLSRIRKHFPKLFVSDMLHNDLEQGYIMRSIEKDEFTNRHIVISNRIKEKMMRKGISEDKISVVYSGIDTQNELNPDNISRKNDENIRLLYLGRMSEEKRPLDFLRIAEKFKHDKKFIFLMAGDGPLRGKVEKFIKKNAIKNLKLLGIANPREVLRDNNIILITSSIEGLPMSMMEAMSMENVVISTNVGEVGKAIISGENGYLVESIGDIDDFAEKIKYLSENREELKKMGKNSRKFAVEKYDVRRMQQEYVNLFNNT